MDPFVYDMMKSLRAAKAAQASGEKVTVKREPGSDTPLSGTKRKLADDAAKQGLPRHEPSTPLDHARGSSSGAAPPGFSAQRTSRSSVRDHDPISKQPRHTPDLPDGGGAAGWEAARRMLQSIVAPPRERAFSLAKPSEVIESSYNAMVEVRRRPRRRATRLRKCCRVLSSNKFLA